MSTFSGKAKAKPQAHKEKGSNGAQAKGRAAKKTKAKNPPGGDKMSNGKRKHTMGGGASRYGEEVGRLSPSDEEEEDNDDDDNFSDNNGYHKKYKV